jgi:hypothetical protein
MDKFLGIFPTNCRNISRKYRNYRKYSNKISYIDTHACQLNFLSSLAWVLKSLILVPVERIQK